MKVLILHQHFNTPEKGGPLRSYFIARAFVDRNISPVIITVSPESKYRVETREGIEVHYLPILYQNQFGFYRRAWSFIRYMVAAVSLARKFHDVKIVYAISTPLTVGIAAIAIKKLYSIPFIFEVGDLWPDAPIEMGFIRNNILKDILRSLERRIYKEARSIVALSDPIAAAIRTRTRNPVFVIPNMADLEFFSPTAKSPFLLKKFNVTDKFVVSYIGAVGFANGLDGLIDLAHKVSSNSRITFIICGDGAMLPALKKEVVQRSLTNILFIPFQNREGVRDLINVTDACLISYRPERILETGSPNKYFDALAAGKVIAINFGGWVKDEIEKNKCGFYVDLSSPELLANIFLLPDTERIQMQRNARLLAENKYDRKILTARIVDLALKEISPFQTKN